MDQPLVLVVTEHWGESTEESGVATRLVAGALSRHARVEIAHLVPPHEVRESYAESVFVIHPVALAGARPLTAAVLRAALVSSPARTRLPDSVIDVLSELEGDAPSLPALLAERAPASIVLAGAAPRFSLAEALEHAPRGPRVVYLPLCADLSRLSEEQLAQMMHLADAIGASSPREYDEIARRYPERQRDLFAVNLALNVNKSATAQGLFGVRFFGRYVLLLRSFPPGGPRYSHSVSHELLRSILGEVAVAEVDGDKWRIADRENTLELPVNPTRVNLWRLMAHAMFMVDLRPQGPLGREAIESMLLGTPVIVPEDSAAGSHVKAASAGLWYRDPGELLDCSRALMDRSLRQSFARQALSYAGALHGDMDGFVTSITKTTLG